MNLFSSSFRVFALAILLRVALLIYGLIQDAYSPIKYTDIDYQVFTSAATFVSQGQSPYERETYRYTPLLAWLLLPTTVFFSFGKVLFATADVITGYLIINILTVHQGMQPTRARKFASLWLWNPMVATISTRGSSEGLLGVMVVGMLWAILQRKIGLGGLLLGLGVHFKIYPFVYGASVLWSLETPDRGGVTGWKRAVTGFLNKERITLLVTSLTTFLGLNTLMYMIYGFPFLQHTFLHHVTRIDHRHNFSPYNTLLYLSSYRDTLVDPSLNILDAPPSSSDARLESLAFLPQLLLSAIILPILLAKKDLASTMLAQTFAFVTFNKVCTSQYFTWYLCLLPLHLHHSRLLASKGTGIKAASLWIATQALWLQQGFQLEFLGKSTFVPGLWASSVAFFGVNCWILGMIVGDTGVLPAQVDAKKSQSS